MLAMRWLFAAPLFAVSIHIFEEFVFPGGFPQWYAEYRPEIATSLTMRMLLLINALLVTICACLAIADPNSSNAMPWMIVASILFWNAIFHARATFRTQRYSPGLISGLLLYIPLSFFGYFQLVRDGLTSVEAAAGSFVLGSTYHIISLANHKRRARKAAQR